MKKYFIFSTLTSITSHTYISNIPCTGKFRLRNQWNANSTFCIVSPNIRILYFCDYTVILLLVLVKSASQYTLTFCIVPLYDHMDREEIQTIPTYFSLEKSVRLLICMILLVCYYCVYYYVTIMFIIMLK